MISRKPVFEYSLDALFHPASLAAMLLLFLNDHLLRLYWPSWWTGKLGDFAWLFFAPFTCIALLAWLAPPCLHRRPAHLAGAGFGLVAAVFILAKTLPPFHAYTVNALEALLRAPVSLRRDPTDLLALPALGAAAWLWRRAPRQLSPSQIKYGHANGLATLGLAALLTIANAGFPEVGISCLGLQDGRIIAQSSYQSFVSQDGGGTWQMQMGSGSEPASVQVEECRFLSRNGKDVPDPRQPGLRYRYLPGSVIQKSLNDGRSWQTIYNLATSSQLEKAFYTQRGYNGAYYPGPMDLLILPESGDVLFAMGYEGLLRYQPASEEWAWIPVGNYQRVDFHGPDFVGTVLGMLSGEIVLALAYGALVALTAGVPSRRSWWRILVLLAGWIVFFGLLYLKPALNVAAYSSLPELAAFFLLALFLLPLTIAALIAAVRRSIPDALWLLLCIFISAALFFLPFFLWGLEVLPAYNQAAWLGILLGLLPGLIYFFSMRKMG